MNYQELSSLSIDELRHESCECISCHCCRGTGHMYVDSRGRHIPYYDLESCSNCRGGTTETCDRCHLLDEYEQEAQ